jgi:hypothetical protein
MRYYLAHGELPWQDVARSHVLDAVDHARDWSDLRRRLSAHGVVVKLVRRGERVQGLAFAEGFERTARGCAASRIDARCALRALESRFGVFMPTHEPAPAVQPAARWIDTARPRILAAVDAAQSWDDLTQRLSQRGVVIKLVARGGRVQGLTFAEGIGPDAPGAVHRALIRAARRPPWRSVLGPSRAKRSHGRIADANRASAAMQPGESDYACGCIMTPVMARAERCSRPNTSSTTYACAQRTGPIGTGSALSVAA